MSKKECEAVCKPNSVPSMKRVTVIDLGVVSLSHTFWGCLAIACLRIPEISASKINKRTLLYLGGIGRGARLSRIKAMYAGTPFKVLSLEFVLRRHRR